MTPEICADFCNQYNITSIPINHVGFYHTRQELKCAMLDLYHKITSGVLSDFEEGSIMILILRSPNNPSLDRVLSCSKIKTVCYKIFKKLKDKLKHFWAQYESCTFFSNKMQKEYKTKLDRFKIEVNEILKAHHPFD